MNNIPKKERLSGKDIVEFMIKNALTGEGDIRNVETDQPVEARERFEMDRSLLTPDMKFLTLCQGCGVEIEMIDAMGCACGGFVCKDCLADADGETCDHEPPE